MNIIDDLERKSDKMRRSPDDAKNYNDIGVILYQLKDWDNAEKYLCRAYELDPAYPDTQYNYGMLLYHRLKWREAISVFQVYLSSNPDDRKVREKTGDAYYHLEKYEEAAKIYESLHQP